MINTSKENIFKEWLTFLKTIDLPRIGVLAQNYFCRNNTIVYDSSIELRIYLKFKPKIGPVQLFWDPKFDLATYFDAT
jgi:hypothetical protein